MCLTGFVSVVLLLVGFRVVVLLVGCFVVCLVCVSWFVCFVDTRLIGGLYCLWFCWFGLWLSLCCSIVWFLRGCVVLLGVTVCGEFGLVRFGFVFVCFLFVV